MLNNYSPKLIIFIFSFLFVGLSLITCFFGFNKLILSLNENQILYLFSNSAQVISAIYGLTITGFIFFRNELSREEFEDETLNDAVENLKSRYFTNLVFITLLVLITIFLSNLAISYASSENNSLLVLTLNIGQSAFFTSLFAISYFIFDVISPKKIERASQNIKDQLYPSKDDQEKGSLEEFLKAFNQIEFLLIDAGQNYKESSFSLLDNKFQRRLPNSRLAQMLLRNEVISASLYKRIRNLISLRNSIIHGADPVVSQEVVDTSQIVMHELRTALDHYSNRNQYSNMGVNENE